MENKIFSSYFTLNFQHPQVQGKFISMKNTIVKKYSPIFVIIACSLSFIFLTCFLIYSSLNFKPKTAESAYLYTFELYLIISISSIYFLILLSSFLWRQNITLSKWLNYLNYFMSSLEFLSMRTVIFCLFETDLSYYYLIFLFEFAIRVIWHIFHLMDLWESIILILINYVTLGIFHAVMPLHEKLAPNSTIMYTLIIVCIVITTYFNIREMKRSFFYNCELEMKNKWYENVLDNMSSGFMLMKNNTISFLNKNFIESIQKIMTISHFTEASSFIVASADDRELSQCCQVELVRDKILSNTPKVLDMIIASLALEDKSTFPDHPKNFENFCAMYKNSNSISNDSIKFNYIGRGEISQNEISRNIDHEQTIVFEISCRYYSDLEGDNFELIINDISRTKLSEEKSAEFKYKTLFLSKVAHEFKNPIICIIELADQLADEEEIDDSNSFKRGSRMENLYMIKSLSDYLLILIKDLDYFSESQNQKKKSIQITSSDVDLDEIITFSKRVANAILKKNHKDKVITLLFSKSGKFPQYVMTDEIKLKQVLINLLSNAIKFTSCGSIGLEIEKESTEIKFTVSDTGVGISESQKQNIFKPFNKQISKANALGTGLGLAIVYDMTANLGSQIDFSSEVNKGSKFWFSIPFVPSQNERQMHIANKSSISHANSSSATLVVNDNSLYLSKEQYRQILFGRSSDQIISSALPKSKFHTNTRSAHSSLCPSIGSNIIEQHKMNSESEMNIINFVNIFNVNIIVADDESLTRQATVRVITTVATQKGITLNLIQVEDGVETLYEVCKNVMNGKSISCIISDENMRCLDGRRTAELLKSFQSQKNFPKIPFFLLTAYESLQNESYLDLIFTKPLRKSGVEEIFRVIKIEI